MTENTGDDARSFPFPLPASLVETLLQEHDKEHMKVDAFRVELHNFMDSLDKDQLFTLQRMLCLRRGALNMLRGQAIAILRIKFHVDENTGDSLIL